MELFRKFVVNLLRVSFMISSLLSVVLTALTGHVVISFLLFVSMVAAVITCLEA